MNVKSILGVIIGITLVTITLTLSMTTPMLLSQQAEAFTIPGVGKSEPKAPMVASGDNLYISTVQNLINKN
jgi:flagellar basal body-associated protein FliL